MAWQAAPEGRRRRADGPKALILLAVMCVLTPRLAAAQGQDLPAAMTEVGASALPHAAARPQVAVSLQVATPSSLALGAALGVGFAATGWRRRAFGGQAFAVGVECQWTTAEEHAPSWAVRHDGLQALAIAELSRAIGVGALTLRLGVGGLAIRERRLRHQSGRLPDAEVEQVQWGAQPAAQVQVGVKLGLVGGVGTHLRLGPRLGWSARGGAQFGAAMALELAWQP